MKHHRLLRAAWLVVGIVGIPLSGLCLLNLMATGHLYAPIAYRDLPQIERSDTTFQPTLEQYKEACQVVKVLGDRYGNLFWMQLLFIGPVVVLSFISYAAIWPDSKKASSAQPSDEPNGASRRQLS
jgi:hypothetical protein